MGNTPTLIPKRKLMEAFGTGEGDASNQTINTINNVIGGDGTIPETVVKLHVTNRLIIPCGVDMYDLTR